MPKKKEMSWCLKWRKFKTKIHEKKNIEAKLNILLKATNGLEFAHIDPTCYSILSRN